MLKIRDHYSTRVHAQKLCAGVLDLKATVVADAEPTARRAMSMRLCWLNALATPAHLAICCPEVLQVVVESTIPEPGPAEVRIKVLAAGTGLTDTMIRRGRYPDFKGPLPFTPGYEIVGVVEKVGAG